MRPSQGLERAGAAGRPPDRRPPTPPLWVGIVRQGVLVVPCARSQGTHRAHGKAAVVRRGTLGSGGLSKIITESLCGGKGIGRICMETGHSAFLGMTLVPCPSQVRPNSRSAVEALP